jgi:hypothetical protein
MARITFTKEQGYRPIDLLQAAIDHLFAANVLFSAGDFFSAIGILNLDTEAPIDKYTTVDSIPNVVPSYGVPNGK